MRWGWCLVVWSGMAAAQEADPVLSSPAYRFCHEVGVDGAELARFCDLLDDVPASVCPAMRQTCEEERFDGPPSGCGSEGAGGQGLGGSPTPPPEAFALPEMDCAPPGVPAWEALWRWVVALFAALGIVALGGWLVRRVVWRTARPASRGVPVRRGPGAEEREAPSGGGSVAEATYRQAQEALASGDAVGAVTWAWEAGVWRLGDLGRLRPRRSATDREVLAAARRDQEALGLAQRLVERSRWASREVGLDEARAALAAVGKLFLAGLILCAVATPQAWASSRYGPWGDAALYELLEEAGDDLDRTFASFSQLSAAHEVLWLDLWFATLSEDDEVVVREWIWDGGVLVVGGDPSGFLPLPGHRRRSTGRPGETARIGWGDQGGEMSWHLSTTPRWPEGATYEWCLGEEDERVDVLVQLGEPEVHEDEPPPPCEERALIVAWSFGDGAIVLVTDPALWANASLAVPRNREVVRALPRLADRLGFTSLTDPPRTAMATASRGPSQDQGAARLADPRFLPMLFQLIGVWGLAWWALARPSATPRDLAPVDRSDMMAHLAAVATQVGRTGDEAWAAQRYCAWAVGTWGPAGLERAARAAGDEGRSAGVWRDRVVAVADGTVKEDLAFVEAVCRILGRW